MEFDSNKYKVSTWKSPEGLFWLLYPFTFLLELGLGQRRPGLSLVDKRLPGPQSDRTIVPCPHCRKLHDARTWSLSFGTGFKNWFGLYCNHCGKVIPCILSLSSVLILALTFPVWAWFRKPLRTYWLTAQPARFENLPQKYRDPFGEGRWIWSGLVFGAFFFLFYGLLKPLTDGEALSWAGMLTSVPIAVCCGLGLSFLRGTNQ